MAVPLSNLSSTWTGTSGNTALKMSVTDTQNNPNSNLLNFLVNNNEKFRVDKDGNIYANNFVSGTDVINNKFIVAWILS